MLLLLPKGGYAVYWCRMIGTLVNVGAVIAGSVIGVMVRSRLPERLTKIAFQGIGLFAVAIGVSMAIKTASWLVVVFSIVPGAIVGELIDIDRHLTRFGEWLKRRLLQKRSSGPVAQWPSGGAESQTGTPTAGGLQSGDESRRTPDPGTRTPGPVPQDRFAEGMVAAFLLFCMGSMTVLGAIEEGLGKAPNLLLAKSVLDGFASIALAAAFGIGVAFSVIPLLVYQGGLTLLAGAAEKVLSEAIVTEVSAVGGLLLIGLGISLLEIKRVKVLNMLPALVFAALLAWAFLK